MTPIRSCVGCGERAAQATLLRVVWREGQLAADPGRRAGGRGAWLHERSACLDAFVARRGPVRSLRAAVPRAAREQLVRALRAGARGGEE